ncbi:uncharacterized protein LOC112577388 [Pomacea canaliculata]|nr:uncharacterized protein LOC112577388 [Pomacea canaliculata]
MNPDFFVTWTVVAGVVWVYSVLAVELLISVLLAVTLLRHSRRRKDITTSDGDKRDRQVRQTTKTVLVSSLLFLFLNLLQVTNSIADSLVPTYNSLPGLRYTYLFVHNMGTAVLQLESVF